jgi:hypothetical protein
MALQTSGPISLDDIRQELGISGAISLNDPEVRLLAGKPSGPISLSDFYGKFRTLKTRTTVYTSDTTVVVPEYESVAITLLGAGGPDRDDGFNATRAIVTGGGLAKDLIANAGGRGRYGTPSYHSGYRQTDEGDYYYNYVTYGPGIRGSAGTASGGDQNITGGGKAGSTDRHRQDGPGGYGGKCVLTRSIGSNGAPVVGQTMTVDVGNGANTPSITFDWSYYVYS